MTVKSVNWSEGLGVFVQWIKNIRMYISFVYHYIIGEECFTAHEQDVPESLTAA